MVDLIISNSVPVRQNLLGVPVEILHEILSYTNLYELARLQETCTTLYNFILADKKFSYYNTVKFFELYYRQRLFALFLFPYVHPRYSYRFCKERPSEINSGADWSAASDDMCPGNTVFHIAAANGLHDVVARFLRREYGSHLPAMSNAAYDQQAKTYLYLKQENKSCMLVDMINEEPNTPLHYICILPDGVSESDLIYTAKMLIRAGSNLWRKGRAGNTALAEAAQHGQVSMVKLVVEEYQRDLDASLRTQSLSTYINTPNDYNENAVILSARSHPHVLEFLLQNGGDPNSSRRGFPILHIVCSRFQLDRRDPIALSEYHTQRTSPQRWNTPVQNLNFSESDTEDEDEILEEEELSGQVIKEDDALSNQLNSLTFDQASSSATLLRRGRKTTTKKKSIHDCSLRLLIKYGADPRAIERETGMRPLHTAAFWGDQTAIEQLIHHAGVDPNQELNETNGWLPIHYACSEGQVFAIQTLVANGARIWDFEDVTPEPQENENDSGIEDDDDSSFVVVPQPMVPRYPFEVDISRLPQGTHVPAPLELLQFDVLKSKIRNFARYF